MNELSTLSSATEPIHQLWIQPNFYRQFSSNVYRKFTVVNLKVNMCGWLNGTSKSHMLDFSIAKYLKIPKIIWKCPLNGYFYYKNDNMSFDILAFDLLFPSGRYRGETTHSRIIGSHWLLVNGLRSLWFTLVFPSTVSQIFKDVEFPEHPLSLSNS